MGRGSKRLLQLLVKQLEGRSGGARGIATGAGRAGTLPGAGDAAHGLPSQTRGAAAVSQAAVKTKPMFEATPILDIKQDLYGATTPVTAYSFQIEEGVYKNIDGHRFEDGRYKAFMDEISAFIPKERQFTDPVRTYAYGTDASFYRLNPKLVVKIHSEEEVRKILPIAKRLKVSVTFRAAGTSLSAQALTDSVLLKLSHTGKHFRKYEVHDDGSSITVEPGLIGGEVNRILAAHQRKGKHPIQYKIGPDPSSIDSCMVGGIVNNNSSGMCCGVSQNTYHTLKELRVVFLDGSVLDTADPASREAFVKAHPELVSGVQALAARVQADRQLSNLIRRKFAIKCTTGYSLNALVDFPPSDPVEIIKHLIVGSEGTLGFVSRATYNTVPEWPAKASAFIVFPDVQAACKAAAVLRNDTSVDAVEVFDRKSLQECEGNDELARLVPDIRGAGKGASALLIECRGQDEAVLQERIQEIHRALSRSGLPLGAHPGQPRSLQDYPFRHDPRDTKVLWDVRRGLIPIVGAARETGTSMLLEDVACPVDNLAGMMTDLVEMFQRYGYHDASCFGHALEGNLHLVFAQSFRTKSDLQRFSEMFEELCYIVATKHSGSLKGEHGTGRNVAPFVEMEWGSKAYQLMAEIKQLFDPDEVLNPGVILNPDPDAHIKFIKSSPPASPIVDRCIECGFCEPNCPSRDLSLTPRQRIAVYKEVCRLQRLASPSPAEAAQLAALRQGYAYLGEATCAADGMCQEKCPVKINTGEMIKQIRSEQLQSSPSPSEGSLSSRAALWLASPRHFPSLTAVVPRLLNALDTAHRLLGPGPLAAVSGLANRLSGGLVPVWNPYMPRGAAPLKVPPPPAPAPAPGASPAPRALPRQVVYLPSCVTRMMGPAQGDSQTDSVHEVMMRLLSKAGYEVIIPQGVQGACCGMIFNSRGFKDAAAQQGAALEAALHSASQGGKLPILMDTSPCLAHIKAGVSDPALRFAMYEPVEFIRHFLVDKLEWRKVRDTIAVHVPCSSKKMAGVEEGFAKLAGLCAHEVVHSGVACCGMAGDRGMRYPELPAASLQHLPPPAPGCRDGYSSSRTCEVALSNASGMHYRGLVYLVDEATAPKAAAKAAGAAQGQCGCGRRQ